MSKKLFALIAGAALTASMVVVTAGPVAADDDGYYAEIGVEVTKELINPPLQEASFTVKLVCTDEDGNSDSDTATIDWRKPGNSSWKLLPPQVTLYASDDWESDVTCVVTETANGGATTSTITCDDAEDADCVNGTLVIDIDDIEDEGSQTYGEFTVVNDFTPTPTTTTVPATPVTPAAPAAVVAQPTVTG